MNSPVRFVSIYLFQGDIFRKVHAILLCVELSTKESVDTVASVASVLKHANDVLVARDRKDIEMFHNASLISLSINSDLLLTDWNLS